MKLNEQEYQLLRKLQRSEKHKSDYVKITVLLMLHLGEEKEKIATYLGISVATVYSYKRKYETFGLEQYLQINYKAYEGKLSQTQKAALEVELQTNLYQNSAQIVDWVSSNFAKFYTKEGIIPLIHHLGFILKQKWF